MDLLGDLFGNSKRSKKSDLKKSNSQSDDTFILEPILTPSGIVDGDDGSDPVIIESDIDLGEDLDFEDLEGEDVVDLTLDNTEVVSKSHPEEDLEPLFF
ncbi:MAG: hypothetical protein SXA11_21755, partial [Cyanobacteriota bacterium]|nr:hypothetical protein [Cyanobacteriota bacterium]